MKTWLIRLPENWVLREQACITDEGAIVMAYMAIKRDLFGEHGLPVDWVMI